MSMANIAVVQFGVSMSIFLFFNFFSSITWLFQIWIFCYEFSIATNCWLWMFLKPFNEPFSRFCNTDGLMSINLSRWSIAYCKRGWILNCSSPKLVALTITVWPNTLPITGGMRFVFGYGIVDWSSNPVRGCLHFTSH